MRTTIKAWLKNSSQSVFYLCVAYMIFIIILRIQVYGAYIFYPQIYGDEIIWQNVSINPFSEYSQSHDNKSPVFLLANNILQIQNTVLFTRLFNIIMWVLIVLFVYYKTAKKESLLIFMFAIFNDPLILFDVVFETLFILLAISYDKYSGVFVGLAGVFRPYAFIYTLLLNKKQKIFPLIFGIFLSIIMLITGGFFPYLYNVIGYGENINGGYLWIEQHVYTVGFYLILLFSLMIISYSDKNRYWYWGILSCVPLILRTYDHYFIPPIIIFYYIYLCKNNP